MRTGIVCGIGKFDVILRTIIHDIVAQPVAPGFMDEETRLATECHIIRPLCIGRPSRFVTCGLISNPLQIGSYIFRHHVFRTPRLIENKIPAGMRPVPEQDVAASVAIKPNAGRYLRKIIEGNSIVPVRHILHVDAPCEKALSAPRAFLATETRKRVPSHQIAVTLLSVNGYPVPDDVFKHIVHHRISTGVPHPNHRIGIPCGYLRMPQPFKPATGHYTSLAPVHRYGTLGILEIPEREATDPNVLQSGKVEHRTIIPRQHVGVLYYHLARSRQRAKYDKTAFATGMPGFQAFYHIQTAGHIHGITGLGEGSRRLYVLKGPDVRPIASIPGSGRNVIAFALPLQRMQHEGREA